MYVCVFDFVRICVPDEKQKERSDLCTYTEVAGLVDLKSLYFWISDKRSHSDKGISSTHILPFLLSADSSLCCFLFKK